MILLDHLGYGTYLFKTQSRVDTLDVNATVGYFVWDAYGNDDTSGESHNREFDFEDSRWGVPSGPNSQSIVQPDFIVGNRHRYYLPDLSTNSTLTRFFRWQPGSIEFVALKGDQSQTNYPPASVIDNWVYRHDPSAGHYVPSPGQERFRFNLWLNNPDTGPANSQPIEVVISDFTFTPLAKPAITAIERMENDLHLTFTSELGGHYAVQSRSNLSAGSWMTLSRDISSDGALTRTTVTNAFSQPQQFYRIQQTP
ncbi:MAG TPA: hypothetical protein PLT00_06125 [Verrucomicrobiota bacterium]|nr:MAG: hypothetical protein BWX84_00114 [Verrucomicrobia bacterium ADurb.Bin118]HPY29777.1 hypothetical protein [Verrucomicrobiota bacterium]HQB16274.1 hypothetical protein [Verrucomicrobiota bacterium]